MTHHKRDYLNVTDLSLGEAREVLELSRRMKAQPKGAQRGVLAGKSIAVVLEKPSTRTRVSFEVGIADLGAYPVVLQTAGSQLGRGEPIRDTARVLERYCDMIVYRTFETARLKDMASVDVPVINALTDDGHPVQVLCDVLTCEESFEKLGDVSGIGGKRVAFIGDCSSNMARSWLEAAHLFGFHLVLAAPKGYFPPEDEIEKGKKAGVLSLFTDPTEAAKGCDAINTDVWTSMGQEAENAKRMAAFAGWTITEKMLAGAKPNGIVLHCLPAHRGEEIDDATLEGARSRVWDQAGNRLHVQKGLMVWLLGAGEKVGK